MFLNGLQKNRACVSHLRPWQQNLLCCVLLILAINRKLASGSMQQYIQCASPVYRVSSFVLKFSIKVYAPGARIFKVRLVNPSSAKKIHYKRTIEQLILCCLLLTATCNQQNTKQMRHCVSIGTVQLEQLASIYFCIVQCSLCIFVPCYSSLQLYHSFFLIQIFFQLL